MLALIDALPPALARAVLAVASVRAQVTVTPTSSGIPGGTLLQTVLNWLGYLALAGSLASLLLGGMVWGISQHAGNGYQAGRGRTYAAAGAAGALLTGLAATIVNTLYKG